MPVENFILTLKTPSLHGKIVNVAPSEYTPSFHQRTVFTNILHQH